jgi:hypothetical protein
MGQKYSDEDLVNAVEQAAADIGEPISKQEYKQWRKRNGGNHPTVNTITHRLGWQGPTHRWGWKAVCDKASVESKSH